MSSVAAAPHGLASLYAAMIPPPPPAEPVVDIEAITDEAYQAGFAAGASQAEAALLPERAAMATATSALIAATTVDADALRGVFIALVRSLAEAVVASELRQNPEVVSRLVDVALASVATREGLAVRLHPDDVPALSLDLPIVGDPTCPRGSVLIDAPEFVVRDGLDVRLAVLIETLS